jgi:hypothetical protein
MHKAGEACDCPGHAKGAQGQGCPMLDAKKAGVTAKVEQTERGAVIRLEGPQGNVKARDEARASAQRVANLMEEGCPHATKPGMEKATKAPPAGAKTAKPPPAAGTTKGG